MSAVTSNEAPACPVCKRLNQGISAEPSQNPVQFTVENTLSFMKKDEPEKNQKSINSGWFSTRHYVTMMLFFGMANFMVVRAYVSIVIGAMLNRTAYINESSANTDECPASYNIGMIQNYRTMASLPNGKFVWDGFTQICVMYIFYVGSLLFQIPAGFLARRYGSARLIGWGSLIGSALGLILPIVIEIGGVSALYIVRMVQGVIMSPVVPCTIDLLSKWIIPNERSRCVAFVNSSVHFGLLLSIPISGYLSYTSLGWPSTFYFFGCIATVWSVLFIFTVYEDPDSNPTMDPIERKLINRLIHGNKRKKSTSPDRRKPSPIPIRGIVLSGPFYATFVAHVCSLIGFYTFWTVIPIYLNNVLNFNEKTVNILSWLQLLVMWVIIILTGWAADHYFSKGFSRTRIRKLAVALGSFGPAIFTLLSSFSICLTGFNIAMLTMSFGLTGVIYTSATVNHLEISRRYTGFLMSITYTVSIFLGLAFTYLWRSGVTTMQTHEGWKITFLSLTSLYIATGIFFTIFGSGERQHWDEQAEGNPTFNEPTRTETVL